MARTTAGARASLTQSIARTRTLFILLAFVLTIFGIVMIYSASSIEGLVYEATNYDSGYYVKRQLILALAGLVAAVIVAVLDYRFWSRAFVVPLSIVVIVMLVLVRTSVAGQDAYGASRWIALGPIHLQPSEFAKPTLIMVAARLIEDYWDGRYQNDRRELVWKTIVLVLFPLLMIFQQPDKGTVLVIGLTLIIMLFLSGLPYKYVFAMIGAGFAFLAFYALKDDYSRNRILVVFNPWSDASNTGYQLVQGLYAFGSGGLFGQGLGMSHQKYLYLPMAYNDFIYAIVGEELGLVGTLSVLLAFLALVYLGFKIAHSAPDLAGQLIAAGSVSLLAVQLLVNVTGVLCIIPLSGKPIPFLSYGGSSIIATLILVGMVVSVSLVAEAEAAKSTYEIFDNEPTYERSYGNLRVIEGGRSTTPESLRASRDAERSYGSGRVTTNGNGTRRIDLGPSASDRLRRR